MKEIFIMKNVTSSDFDVFIVDIFIKVGKSMKEN